MNALNARFAVVLSVALLSTTWMSLSAQAQPSIVSAGPIVAAAEIVEQGKIVAAKSIVQGAGIVPPKPIVPQPEIVGPRGKGHSKPLPKLKLKIATAQSMCVEQINNDGRFFNHIERFVYADLLDHIGGGAQARSIDEAEKHPVNDQLVLYDVPCGSGNFTYDCPVIFQ